MVSEILINIFFNIFNQKMTFICRGNHISYNYIEWTKGLDLFFIFLSFRALLDRDKDEEMPNLIVLLCESFVAIYMSLLSYALATCDAHILYRLVGQNVANSLWSAVFGGKFRNISFLLFWALFKIYLKRSAPMKEARNQSFFSLSSLVFLTASVSGIP